MCEQNDYYRSYSITYNEDNTLVMASDNWYKLSEKINIANFQDIIASSRGWGCMHDNESGLWELIVSVQESKNVLCTAIALSPCSTNLEWSNV